MFIFILHLNHLNVLQETNHIKISEPKCSTWKNSKQFLQKATCICWVDHFYVGKSKRRNFIMDNFHWKPAWKANANNRRCMQIYKYVAETGNHVIHNMKFVSRIMDNANQLMNAPNLFKTFYFPISKNKLRLSLHFNIFWCTLSNGKRYNGGSLLKEGAIRVV